MPNGISAMATIAIKEGRASRIADYINYSSQLRTPEEGGRAATPRGPRTAMASWAKAHAGVRKRKKMAAQGKMTHGGGGIGWNGPKGRAGAIFGKAYSKIRAKRKHYAPPTPGGVTASWNAYKPPSLAQAKASEKRTGTKHKLKKGVKQK